MKIFIVGILPVMYFVIDRQVSWLNIDRRIATEVYVTVTKIVVDKQVRKWQWNYFDKYYCLMNLHTNDQLWGVLLKVGNERTKIRIVWEFATFALDVFLLSLTLMIICELFVK